MSENGARRQLVEYHLHDHIAVIHMNRPERLNALSLEFMNDFAACWETFRDDDDAWVVILTGDGRAFSTGMDLKERVETDRPYLAVVPEWPYNPWWEERIDKPMIAAIQGYAYGGGFFFAARCDIRIAAENAVFQVTEPVRGGIAGYELQLLENLPYAIAAELASGAVYTAQRAYEVGFVNKVVPEADLLDEAMKVAEGMVSIPPLAVHHNLRLLRDIRRERAQLPYSALRAVDEVWDILISSKDTRESFDAFTEKRTPVYGRH